MKNIFLNDTGDLYAHDMDYARKNGELEMYNESFELNVACSKAIEKAISKSYSDYCLDTQEALKDVRSRFTMKRIGYVLANAIKYKNHDGRISAENKNWAQSIQVTPDKDLWGGDRNCYFVIDRVNPGLVDLFTNRFRKEKSWLDRVNKYSVKEMAPGIRWYVTISERNPKDEKIIVEFAISEDNDFPDTLAKQWYKNGYTDHVLKTWWNVQVYAEAADGRCCGKYNPQVKVSEDGKRQVIDFSWMFEATKENAKKIYEEIYKRAFTENLGWEAMFVKNKADGYCVYQLNDDDANAYLLFMGSDYLRKNGLKPSYRNYHAVYSGEIEAEQNPYRILENLYEDFNCHHPEDFMGRSMSVSDVVALKTNGKITCYYVDSIGFTELENFISEEEES